MLAAQAVFNRQPADEVFPQARESAQRAIELDDSLALAKAALGHVLVMYDRKYADGEALYREARELDPSSRTSGAFRRIPDNHGDIMPGCNSLPEHLPPE